MSSPTIIRHAQTEGRAAIVVTYFEKSFGHTQLMAAFQLYEVGHNGDRTSMVTSSPWSTEQGAIDQFNEWRSAEIGDFPGNL
jgi:hypothetical protein